MRVILLLAILCGIIACSKPTVPVQTVELYVVSREITSVSIDGKPVNLSASSSGDHVIQLTEGAHKLEWTYAGATKTAEFTVGPGEGEVSLIRGPKFIQSDGQITINKPPK